MDTDLHRSLADAEPRAFWLDTPRRPTARDPLGADASVDLAVVGGGFCGLWTALVAKERDPDRRVLLVEADQIGWAASGRNGGFCSASLTHGPANGRARFPEEYPGLARLGAENLDAIERTVQQHGIDCHFERTGDLLVATEPYQVPDLRQLCAEEGMELLDADALRAEVDSPTYLAGAWDRAGTALVDPAELAWGLAAAAERAGVEIVEQTRVAHVGTGGSHVELHTDHGPVVRARRVALATNAFRPLLRRLRYHTIPVYDYVLVTEPLRPDQLASVGWANRQGVSDSANRFHYYRLTPDDRILWGGYDAIYHYGRRISPELDQRPATFELLARQFFETFPQLRGLRFTHRWGGVIDTSTQFFAFHGTAGRGRIAYALGFTGLGVGATRFSANVVLDLLDGLDTERTRLRAVRARPLPFPPEPLAFLGVQATRWSLARADDHEGHRNLWLRTLDRLGLGFDS